MAVRRNGEIVSPVEFGGRKVGEVRTSPTIGTNWSVRGLLLPSKVEVYSEETSDGQIVPDLIHQARRAIINIT